jgi:hypothetical protein
VLLIVPASRRSLVGVCAGSVQCAVKRIDGKRCAEHKRRRSLRCKATKSKKEISSARAATRCFFIVFCLAYRSAVLTISRAELHASQNYIANVRLQ